MILERKKWREKRDEEGEGAKVGERGREMINEEGGTEKESGRETEIEVKSNLLFHVLYAFIG